MKFFRWLTGGTSEIFGTVVQLVVVAILIPLMMAVFSVVMPSSGQNFFMGMITNLGDMEWAVVLAEFGLKLCDSTKYVLDTAINIIGPAFNLVEMLWIQNQTQAASFWDAISVCAEIAYSQGFAGMCIGIFNFGFKLLMKLLHIDGVPVFTTVMGTLFGCMFLTIFPVHETAPYAIWTMCIMMFIGWVICAFCVPGEWIKKIWAMVWTAYDIVIVSACYMYVAVIQMLMVGDMAWDTFGGFLNTVYFVEMAILPFLLLNVFQWVFWPKRKGLFDLLVNPLG